MSFTQKVENLQKPTNQVLKQGTAQWPANK